MTNPASAIRLETSSQRRYAKNSRGLIVLRVSNIDPSHSITAQVELTGDLLDKWVDSPRMLAPDGIKILKIPVKPESNGDFLIHVRVKLECNDGSIHQYTGDFDLAVDAEDIDPRSIHINITNTVPGTGFIDASDLKIPSLHKPASPQTNHDVFTEVLLYQDIFADALARCTLKHLSSSFQLRVLTESRITIGRHAEFVDVVVQEPNNCISRTHCQLERTAQGFCLRNLSTTRPPRLNGIEVRESTQLPISEDSILVLGDQATYRLHPLPTSDLHSRVLEHLIQRGHKCEMNNTGDEELAAFAIIPESTNHACNELTLWLFQTLQLSEIPNIPICSNTFILASVPSVIFAETTKTGVIHSANAVSNRQHIGPFVVDPN